MRPTTEKYNVGLICLRKKVALQRRGGAYISSHTNFVSSHFSKKSIPSENYEQIICIVNRKG